MSLNRRLWTLWLLAGLLTAAPLWGANSITISCPSSGTAGSGVSCSIDLFLGTGVTIDSLTLGVLVTANGAAPALTGTMGFTDSIGGGFKSGTSNSVSVLWSGISPVLSGHVAVGTADFTVPPSATNGQSYSASITGASGLLGSTVVNFTIGGPSTVSVVGPVLNVSPTSLSFTAVQGGSSPANQTVGISNAGGGTLNWSASVTSGTFLSLSGTTSGTNSGTITAVVTLGSLTAGTYNGNIRVTAAGASGSPQDIPVTFTVSPPAPIIGLSPTSLSFTAMQGSSSPANQTVGVSNTGGGTLNWSASVTSGTFLSLSGTTSGTNAGTITAVVTLGSLAPGTYNGNIQVTAAGASNTPQNIPVTFTVTPGPAIGLSPTSLSFSAVQGSSSPANQTVGVSNTGGGTLNWSASVTSGAFLSLSGTTSGTNSGTITAVVTLGSLTAGTYNGNIQVTAAGASNTPQNIAVTFTVAPPPAIGLSPSSLSFTAVQGGGSPANQTVGVSNSGGGTLNWSASVTSGTFLSLGGTTSGTNSGTITAVVTLGSLTVGTYNGNIQVTAAGASNTPQNIPVTLTVSLAPPTISLSASSLSFTAVQGGGSPANQTVGISNTGGGALNWSASVTSGAFLSLSGTTSGTNTGSFTVVATLGALTPGTYNGNVQVTAAGATNTPQNIPVTFTVTPPLSISGPGSLPVGTVGAAYPTTTITATGGSGVYSWSATGLPPGLGISGGGTISGTPTNSAGSPYNVQVTVTDSFSSTANRSYTVTINALALSIITPSLPTGFLNVAYPATTMSAQGGTGVGYTWSATGLPPGLKMDINGTITGTPTTTTGSPFNVHVTVTDSSSATASSTYLLTISSVLAVAAPSSLPVGVLGVPYLSTTVTAGGGTPPYTWAATGLPAGLSIGISTGTITGTPATTTGSPFTVQVTVTDSTGTKANRSYTLTVNGPLSISGPASLPAGTVGVAYLSTTVTVTGGSGVYTWSATGLPAGMSIGSTTGAITGTPSTNLGSPFTVVVTVTDSTSATANHSYTLTINAAVLNLPVITSVSNAAGGQTVVAPNTYVSIYGTNFAPAAFTDDWSKSIVNGKLPITLDGVRVSVGGQDAYVSYVSAVQINVLLPEVGFGSMAVTVTTAVGTSAPVNTTSQQYSPAFFPWPNGQPVATHVDFSLLAKAGTFPGTTTIPAKPGEVIILWGTGFGPTTPTAPTGVAIPVSPTFNTASPVTFTIAGAPAPVYGTALASGYAGLYQVVVTLPASLLNGDYTVIASINGSQSPPLTLTVHN